MKYLLVISNHNPKTWSEAQKEGWDKIEYYPFPNINPEMSKEEIISTHVTDICEKIGKFYGECDAKKIDGYINLQGESTVVLYVALVLAGEDVKFIFPTTERIVEEKDGIKTSIFKFVKWR